ncbi:MAG: response regulator [Opitutales bacterium]
MSKQSSIKILLIEDSLAQAKIIHELVAPSNSRNLVFEHADRLSTGLIQLATGNFDILLLDLMLPDSTGPDTLKTVLAKHPRLAVVVLTGLDDDQLGENLVRSGAQDYLSKNHISRHSLRRTLRHAIERMRIHNEKDLLLAKLTAALAKVKTLEGLLPICSHCKKIRDNRGHWHELEEYISSRTDTQFSHSVCPTCVQVHYPDLAKLSTSGG